jgi:DNA modification methylase
LASIDLMPKSAVGAEVLRSINFDFHGSETGYLTHSLHPYPAKYIPQIPRELIRELSEPGETVADIFCGSGTTLVEALLQSRHAIGIDANPLACLISRAKTTRLNEQENRLLMSLSERAGQIQMRIAPTTRATLWAEESFTSSAPRPDYPAIAFWFEPFVVEELAEILSWCRTLPTEPSMTLALVALSSIIVGVSKQDSDTRYVRREKRTAPGETMQRFSRALQRSIGAVQEFSSKVDHDMNCQVLESNILKAPAVTPFDLMVCSPPYPNAFSYHLYHMTRMVWLGMDQPQFKKEEIGSHRKYSSRGAGGATVETFKGEFSIIFDWMGRSLKKNGFACFVIGDSTIRGEKINNADLISDVAGNHGFVECLRIKRQMQSTKKSFNPAIGKIKTEDVLILQNNRATP